MTVTSVTKLCLPSFPPAWNGFALWVSSCSPPQLEWGAAFFGNRNPQGSWVLPSALSHSSQNLSSFLAHLFPLLLECIPSYSLQCLAAAFSFQCSWLVPNPCFLCWPCPLTHWFSLFPEILSQRTIPALEALSQALLLLLDQFLSEFGVWSFACTGAGRIPCPPASPQNENFQFGY